MKKNVYCNSIYPFFYQMLQTIFQQIPDKRRGQGRMYDLPNVLLFSVLAIMSGADSYRKIETFIKKHFKTLGKEFGAKWKKSPTYWTIRLIIQSVDEKALEKAFREYSKYLMELKKAETELFCVACDGKTLRGSFDHFHDEKAIQILSAFVTNSQIILGHKEIKNKKTNEIPKAQAMIKELGLKDCVFTFDAMHCQKKHLK